ncbi:hypothetical protein OGATHE_005060 [Ogataea polymorpha]|uniref:Uncharacterized protein n=1 Tax=Ogataea polymorpha TaxID=460523 RepID=A0A9P8NUT5_9ASCO|nr:hypothetical protein OGATHE_005060 [Ogataea polymorpha]
MSPPASLSEPFASVAKCLEIFFHNVGSSIEELWEDDRGMSTCGSARPRIEVSSASDEPEVDRDGYA